MKDGKEPLDAAAVEERFPSLADRLSRSPGIGFVLARSANGNGTLCGRHRKNLIKMPSAGDLVIYGTDSPDGDVSFIREHGAHAGPAASEMHTFIIRPAKVTLPSPINHPCQLYDHFIRYQGGW
ncbi:MAG: hypothetical protein AB7S93_23675 [Xanthobacteraceae bacterium]